MSTNAILAATAALAFLLGRLSAVPRIRNLRTVLSAALHAAAHDRLTGLPNRALAELTFTIRAQRTQRTLVVLLDLDQFKHLNDTHGHQAGDELLIEVARRLATTAKAHGGTAARLGGDEFLLMLPVNADDHVHPVAVTLHTLTQPIQITGIDGATTVTPHASAGITVFDGLNGTFATVMREADIALYHAKQQTGSCHSYRPGMRMPNEAGRHGPRLRDRHRHNSSTGSGVTE